MRSALNAALLFTAGMSLVACTNPTVDPNAEFTAKGRVMDQMGNPLAGVEVRLIKYSDPLNIFQPGVENIFSDSPSTNTALDLNVQVIATFETGMDGTYSTTLTGEQIAKPGGFMTGTGLVEVASVIAVVRDPNDKEAGVFTYEKLFMTSDFIWDAGDLQMWAANAVADASDALTTGQVKLSWDKLQSNKPTNVRNQYRVWLRGKDENTPTLVIYCSQGDSVSGGCAEDAADSNKVARFVSAYSVAAFYADTDGEFTALVQGNGNRYRFVSRFTVQAPVPDITTVRDPVAIEGVWAVDDVGGEQDLLNTSATDGNVQTRETLNISATGIYAKLGGVLVTDAGLLNTVAKGARDGCLILEFSVNAYTDLAGATGAPAADWEQKGKFCGENGGADEVSALASFDTTSLDGVQAAWMRVRTEPDGGVTAPTITAVGEVAVFQKSSM